MCHGLRRNSAIDWISYPRVIDEAAADRWLSRRQLASISVNRPLLKIQTSWQNVFIIIDFIFLLLLLRFLLLLPPL